MFRIVPLASVVLLLCAPARSAESWLLHPRWDEGLAEVALMEGQLRRYGALHDVTLDAITVREYFDPDRLVKTAPAEDKQTLPVMKLNLSRRFRTGVYEYRQASSAFVHRHTGELVKLSVVSSEWCGNSFALALREEGGDVTLRISNYMDDRGWAKHRIAEPEAPVFREALLLHLRHQLDQLQPGTPLLLAAPLMTNDPVFRSDRTAVSRVKRSSEEVVVEISFPFGKETFTFATDPLHTWTGWSNSRGEYLKLRKTLFLDYWNRTQPGDEDLLR